MSINMAYSVGCVRPKNPTPPIAIYGHTRTQSTLWRCCHTRPPHLPLCRAAPRKGPSRRKGAVVACHGTTSLTHTRAPYCDDPCVVVHKRFTFRMLAMLLPTCEHVSRAQSQAGPRSTYIREKRQLHNVNIVCMCLRMCCVPLVSAIKRARVSQRQPSRHCHHNHPRPVHRPAHHG